MKERLKIDLQNVSTKIHRYWLKELLTIVSLVFFVMEFNRIAGFLEPFMGKERKTVEWAPLYELTLDYLFIVVISSLISLLIAFSMGVCVHVFALTSVKELLQAIGSLGTTFPTIAVIALLVPLLGYGFKPVIIALIIYGIFPILVNTLNGLEQVDRTLIQAANGLGMTSLQRLIKIELPLTLEFILAGVKTSFIINIAAATVGAVVGAGGLGMPIVSGIRTNDSMMILKGAIPVALIALLANQLFARLERLFKWRIR
jgi:osmoprotectant transport system permease protein